MSAIPDNILDSPHRATPGRSTPKFLEIVRTPGMPGQIPSGPTGPRRRTPDDNEHTRWIRHRPGIPKSHWGRTRPETPWPPPHQRNVIVGGDQRSSPHYGDVARGERCQLMRPHSDPATPQPWRPQHQHQPQTPTTRTAPNSRPRAPPHGLYQPIRRNDVLLTTRRLRPRGPSFSWWGTDGREPDKMTSTPNRSPISQISFLSAIIRQRPIF